MEHFFCIFVPHQNRLLPHADQGKLLLPLNPPNFSAEEEAEFSQEASHGNHVSTLLTGSRAIRRGASAKPSRQRCSYHLRDIFFMSCKCPYVICSTDHIRRHSLLPSAIFPHGGCGLHVGTSSSISDSRHCSLVMLVAAFWSMPVVARQGTPAMALGCEPALGAWEEPDVAPLREPAEMSVCGKPTPIAEPAQSLAEM